MILVRAKLKNKLIILIILSLSFSQKQVIAVSNITSDGLSEFQRKIFFNKIESELVNMGAYEVTSRQEVDKILQEQKFQNSGCTDQQCAAEIGRLLNADLMLLTEILYDKNSKYISANLKLVSVETAKIQTAISKDGVVSTPTDILDKLSGYILELYRRDVSGSTQSIALPVNESIPNGRGTLSINSDPMGAMIILDNKNEGLTPKTIENVSAETHRLILTYEGFERAAQSITITADSVLEINQTLLPLTGNLSIVTDPPNAIIYVNNEFIGNSPFQLDYLDVGSYFIKIEHEGYDKYVSKVDVQHDDTTEINKRLDPIPATVNLFSVPDGVSVYVDKKLVGLTTFKGLLIELTPGPHSFEFKKNGYFVKTGELDLLPNEKSDLDVSLKKLPKGVSDDPNVGWLSISGIPTGSMINIDNSTQTAPISFLELGRGKYSYKVSKTGFESQKGQVSIIPKKHKDLKLILHPLDRKTAVLRSILFPGFGQYYTENTKKGLIFSGLTIAGVSLIVNELNNYSEKTKIVDYSYSEYINAVDDISEKASIYQADFDNQQKSLYAIGGYSAVVVSLWIWNVIDAKKSIPSVFSNISDVKVSINKIGQIEVNVRF